MKSFKKILTITIGTATIFGTSVFAATGIVNAPSGLILRESASSSGKIITTIEDETKVEVLQKEGDWYKVKTNNNEGYLYAEYVDVEEEIEEESNQEETTENNSEQNQIVASNEIKVYMIPVISSTVINTISKDAEITVEKQITNWSYVTAGEITGWVRTYAINNTIEIPTEPENNETPSTKPEEEPEKPVEPKQDEEENQPSNTEQTETEIEEISGYVIVEYANIRKQPTTSEDNIITTLTKGTKFMIVAETEEWYKIKYTSTSNEVYEGYIFKELAIK